MGASLGYGEVFPHATGEFQLEDPALIRVEEVGPLRDSVGASRAYAAPFPSERAHAPSMLLNRLDGLDPVFHPVLEPSRPSRN